MKQPSKLMNRNFFLLWQGRSVSLLGAQAYAVAMLFWIKHATGSAALMGIVLMVSNLPGVILGPLGGAYADRHSRRNIILFCEALNGVAILSLAALMFTAPDATNYILVGLFIVSVLGAVVGSFFNPAISAAIPDLVPKDKVTTANSLSQIAFQLAVFVGQGTGGTLFRLLGAPVLFLINGFTYLFSAGSVAFVSIPQAMPEDNSSEWKKQLLAFKRDIVEGFDYIWRTAGLRELVFISAFLTFFTVPVIILLPFYVENFLQVEADWYGFLLATYGAGSLIGYLVAGSANLTGKARGNWMVVLIILEAAGYGLLGLVRDPVMAMGLAFIGGGAGGYITVNITTILQISTPGEIRGRVFGLLGTIAASLSPLAMGLAGVVADLLGQNIPLIYLGCGVIMTALSFAVLLKREVREFLAYEQHDDLPPAVEKQIVPLN